MRFVRLDSDFTLVLVYIFLNAEEKDKIYNNLQIYRFTGLNLLIFFSRTLESMPTEKMI